MSTPEKAKEIGEWMTVARMDWARIPRNLRDEDPNAAGFFLQQSLEKYLKAFLLTRGWDLVKIHELDALLDDAVAYEPALRSFYPLCERVTSYYFLDRYPPLGLLDTTCVDIERDLADARDLIRTLFPDENLSP